MTIITELDHAINATKADLKLRPTKLIIIGNPKLDTPLMIENQNQLFTIFSEIGN